jgi:hypothetical protein
MDRLLANQLVFFVNDPATREAYEMYVSYRIDYLKEQLCTTRDADEIKALQGAIKELRRFLTLRDEVLSKKDK